MHAKNDRLLAACARIVYAIKRRKASTESPLIVALDGPSGSGKSTIASRVANEFEAALIPLDDFFSADIPDHQWDLLTVPERLDKVFTWERVRAEALLPLRRGEPARWHAFDFQGGLRPDGTYGMESQSKVRQPADVVILEGAYSASPKLSDLIDLAILVDVPIEGRHARLEDRDDPNFLSAWHARWDDVESYYRRCVRPKGSYDLVIELE